MTGYPTHGLEPVEVESSRGPGGIRTSTQQVGRDLVVSVAGELDLFTEPTAWEAVERAPSIARHPTTSSSEASIVVLDLWDLQLLSARGMQLLMRATEAAAAWGIELRVATGDQPAVLRPLQIVELDLHLRVYPTRAEALARRAVFG